MKFIKIKSVEILTNGSLNFNTTGFIRPGQTLIFKQDYKSLDLSQKQKNRFKFDTYSKSYKTHYKI